MRSGESFIGMGVLLLLSACSWNKREAAHTALEVAHASCTILRQRLEEQSQQEACITAPEVASLLACIQVPP